MALTDVFVSHIISMIVLIVGVIVVVVGVIIVGVGLLLLYAASFIQYVYCKNDQIGGLNIFYTTYVIVKIIHM